jgi:hypothetical protein
MIYKQRCLHIKIGLKIAKFTPKVIAIIEYFQPLLGKSYLICQKLEADFNMQAPLFKNHPNKQTIFELDFAFSYFSCFILLIIFNA